VFQGQLAAVKTSHAPDSDDPDSHDLPPMPMKVLFIVQGGFIPSFTHYSNIPSFQSHFFLS
jgi:hypothetical protein